MSPIFYVFLGLLLALLSIAFGYWREARKRRRRYQFRDRDVTDLFVDKHK